MYFNESFLSFVWQFHSFDTLLLRTTSNDEIIIKHPGHINYNSGPDFLQAKIRIGRIEWVGAVEIHLKSSDWNRHKHKNNPEYNQVVLHVVWEHDVEVNRFDGSVLPCFELKSRVSPQLINRYTCLVYNEDRTLPCRSQIQDVERIIISTMIDSAFVERLQRKINFVLDVLKETGNNWEETSYRILMRNFGFNINKDNMFLLSKFLPYSLVSKHQNNRFQVEALLFGMAGFLAKPNDDYHLKLQQEYMFLKHKYNLEMNFFERYQWKFLRLRPQNFPTVRLAQLAGLLANTKNIFTYILQHAYSSKIFNEIRVSTSEYWHKRYDFGHYYRGNRINSFGKESVKNIYINTIAPILAAYGTYISNKIYYSRAINLLQKISPEDNKVIKNWINVGIVPEHAFDSQGLIEITNCYCSKKRCLNCAIGTKILSNQKTD